MGGWEKGVVVPVITGMRRSYCWLRSRTAIVPCLIEGLAQPFILLGGDGVLGGDVLSVDALFVQDGSHDPAGEVPDDADDGIAGAGEYLVDDVHGKEEIASLISASSCFRSWESQTTRGRWRGARFGGCRQLRWTQACVRWLEEESSDAVGDAVVRGGAA